MAGDRTLRERFFARVERVAYTLYERRLEIEMASWSRPRHIGIILDGNRRFARASGARHVVEGHRAGADKLEEVLSWCEEAGVEVVTLWVFSLDNFTRADDEVDGLMQLFEERFRALVTDPRIHRDAIRVRAIGRRERLPEGVRRAIEEAEQATRHYRRRTLNIGVAYGGREEIVDAARGYLEKADKSGLSVAEAAARLDADTLREHLYTADQPDPDLIIRTSGEIRLSGFLLWQSAHSEFYFCDTHWPAFRKVDFLRALRSYHVRQRRYGR